MVGISGFPLIEQRTLDGWGTVSSAVSLPFIKKRLQDQRSRDLVDDLAVLLPRAAGLIEDLVGFAAGQALVPQVNGQAGEFAQLGGKGLSLGRLRAWFAGEMHWVAHHDARYAEAPAEARQRTEILTPAAAPFQRQHGLRRQAQLVRHRHTNATVADVETEKTR